VWWRPEQRSSGTMPSPKGTWLMRLGCQPGSTTTTSPQVLIGYMIMRLALVAQWLRAAREHPEARPGWPAPRPNLGTPLFHTALHLRTGIIFSWTAEFFSVRYCKSAVFALSAYPANICISRAAPGGSTTRCTGSMPLGMLIVSSFPVSLIISAVALLVTLASTSISSYPTS